MQHVIHENRNLTGLSVKWSPKPASFHVDNTIVAVYLTQYKSQSWLGQVALSWEGDRKGNPTPL